MAWAEIGDSICPVARALAVVGDRWTMLILRELFLGTKRFEVFQVQTGMSPHLLSSRLKRLEADGVIDRHRYSDRPVRHEYRLTDKGLDFYPLLLSLRSWGEKWGGYDDGAEQVVAITHRRCGHDVGLTLQCPDCGEPFGAKDTQITIGKAFAAERAARQGNG